MGITSSGIVFASDGAVQLVSRHSISLEHRAFINAGGGTAGYADQEQTAGGGGSGGGILLEVPAMTIADNTGLVANGAGGVVGI